MSSKPLSQCGVTLIEMIVSIVLFGAMAAVGSLLISKLAPSYLAGVQAEQALSPREAALWRLSEDFRRSLVDGMGQTPYPDCNISMLTVSGLNGDQPNTYWARYWPSGAQIWMSNASVSGMLLDNVIASGSCPFNYVSNIGTVSRAQLNVGFQYSTGGYESIVTPISTTLRSYVNGPYVSSVSPPNGLIDQFTLVSVYGIFPGMELGIISSVTFMNGAAPVSYVLTAAPTSSVFTASISSSFTGTASLVVTTPEGKSTLMNAFTFQ
ncbi:MAG: prepilin-type N-terminal cleavage/methylation domain-containing protein [Sulfuricellaceae bacterium]